MQYDASYIVIDMSKTPLLEPRVLSVEGWVVNL